ncbi:putative NADH:ubiquinone reductase (H(+)-translocating) [Lupinus albus]|uniref:Putative NADH:ubiquinone reductase (H(+)-translocating) n=1 Tax=Lupinus albus TaxID=3870 RepID=A0A6A4NTJ4_LUPAL|nr:putative NADH:ubiquinone reductase (H(+)-translocating) [Lupinus albus]
MWEIELIPIYLLLTMWWGMGAKRLEIIFYIGFLIAFSVKSPIIPFHTWLPDTHGKAHYITCMLLAGILLKMGAYGYGIITPTLILYFLPG